LNKHSIYTYREAWPIASRKTLLELNKKQLEIFFVNIAKIKGICLSEEAKSDFREVVLFDNVKVCCLMTRLIYDTAMALGIDTHAKRWIEKTPRHIFCLDNITSVFPHAKIVVVKREATKVAVSQYRTFGQPLLLTIAEARKASQASADLSALGIKQKEQIKIVDYETLLESNDAINELLRYVGVDIPLEMIDSVRDGARKVFQIVYGGTNMAIVQSQMKSEKLNKNVVESELVATARQLEDGLFACVFGSKNAAHGKSVSKRILFRHYREAITHRLVMHRKSMVLVLFRCLLPKRLHYRLFSFH